MLVLGAVVCEAAEPELAGAVPDELVVTWLALFAAPDAPADGDEGECVDVPTTTISAVTKAPDCDSRAGQFVTLGRHEVTV